MKHLILSFLIVSTIFPVQAVTPEESLIINHLPINKNKEYEVREARITKYGWTGYKMACGKYPYIGAVATSDRSIPMGTLVEVWGKKYIICDKTAKWVHKKHGFTIDLYSEESKADMLLFGDPTTNIKIYY